MLCDPHNSQTGLEGTFESKFRIVILVGKIGNEIPVQDLVSCLYNSQNRLIRDILNLKKKKFRIG
jgi:hypothetical protein